MRTVAECVAVLAEGSLTSVDLVEEALRRAEATQPELRAFARLRADRARAEAAVADELRRGGDTRPLLGVPFAAKANHDLAGEPATDLGTGREQPPAAADHPWIAALRGAGAVCVGQTTMPELALWPYGPSRNPWDPTRSAGGSSTGSGAAVAAGVVPFATASDGAGSIRIPAALNGLVGLKLAPGVVPSPDHWHGMTSAGVLTRTTRDTALVLSAALGDGRWTAAAGAAPTGLRVGLALRLPSPLGARPSAEVAGVVERAAELLRAAGHTVTSVSLPIAAVPLSLVPRYARGGADDIAELAAPGPLSPSGQLVTWLGRRFSPKVVAGARRRGDAIREKVRGLPVDVLLTPTTYRPAQPQAGFEGNGAAKGMFAALPWADWTGPWNVTGLPALSAPVGVSAEGLPIGVQLVDVRGDGAVLLGLAQLLEEQLRWAERRPAVSA